MGLVEKPLLSRGLSDRGGILSKGLGGQTTAVPVPLGGSKEARPRPRPRASLVQETSQERPVKREFDRSTHKFCVKCKEVRAKEEFGSHDSSADGLQSYCRLCKNELGRLRREKNVKARLRHHISTRVRTQLGDLCPENVTRDLDDYLGYNIGELVKHLSEDLKVRGVRKSLRACLSEGWHVDHLYPLSRFKVVVGDQVDWDEFRRCWAITNLSAVPAQENLKKGSKVTEQGKRARSRLRVIEGGQADQVQGRNLGSYTYNVSEDKPL